MLAIDELKPFIAVLGGLLSGALVAHGLLDPANASVFQVDLATATGDTVLAISAVYGLHRWVHRHPVQGEVQAPDQVTNQTNVEVTPPADGSNPAI